MGIFKFLYFFFMGIGDNNAYVGIKCMISAASFVISDVVKQFFVTHLYTYMSRYSLVYIIYSCIYNIFLSRITFTTFY